MTLPTRDELTTLAERTLDRCGVQGDAGDRTSTSPVNGEVLSSLRYADSDALDEAVQCAQDAFGEWRKVPAPARGALVKRWAELLAEHKDDLATLVSLEVGKITSEARGEIQEMIDICDFAVGLSRQLYGRTMPSERAGHRLMETWHPLGVVGVISAFNFPAAVWSWNTAVALVCGDPVIWKPSEVTPLTSLACAATLQRAIADVGAPAGISQLLVGGADVGQALVEHEGVALLSATGSTRMGRTVGPRVAERFGRTLLELGGNNAAVVSGSADLDLTVRGVVFSAAGTAGQRCTTMRRVIAHRSIVDELTDRLASAYERLPIGNPMTEGTLVGPLVHGKAYDGMQAAVARATDEGGKVVAGGGRKLEESAPNAYYVQPASSGSRPSRRWCSRRRSHRSSTCCRTTTSRRRSSSTTRCPTGCRRACSPTTRPRPSCSCRTRGPTAASSTSTSARPAPRSAARSAARRRPAAAASPARTRGGPTCAGRPTR
jgi:aldehyde dehydrogenase (NAD+)